MREICSKLIKKKTNDVVSMVVSGRFGVFMVRLEQITHCSGVSIFDFERINAVSRVN